MPCEAAMVVIFFKEFGDLARGRRVLYFLDNASSLHAYARGASKSMPVARCVQIAYILAGELHSQPWFEFVDSTANWSDGASRLLFADPFCKKHRFRLRRSSVPARWWCCTTQDLNVLLRAACTQG